MQSRTTKILYWIVTLLFAVAMLTSGVLELLMTESSNAVLQHLGYPVYLNIILGVAKIVGALVLLQTQFKIIKEWAYAGFTIDFIGAGASMYFAGDGLLKAASPVIFLAVLFASYYLWKKVYSL